MRTFSLRRGYRDFRFGHRTSGSGVRHSASIALIGQNCSLGYTAAFVRSGQTSCGVAEQDLYCLNILDFHRLNRVGERKSENL